MDGDDHLGPGREFPLEVLGIHVERPVDVGDHRSRAAFENRLDSGDECVRLRDHLIPGPDPHRLHGHLERGGARRHGVCVAGARKLRERRLEILHLVHVVAHPRERLPKQHTAVVEHFVHGLSLVVADDLPAWHGYLSVAPHSAAQAAVIASNVCWTSASVNGTGFMSNAPCSSLACSANAAMLARVKPNGWSVRGISSVSHNAHTRAANSPLVSEASPAGGAPSMRAYSSA